MLQARRRNRISKVERAAVTIHTTKFPVNNAYAGELANALQANKEKEKNWVPIIEWRQIMEDHHELQHPSCQ